MTDRAILLIPKEGRKRREREREEETVRRRREREGSVVVGLTLFLD